MVFRDGCSVYIIILSSSSPQPMSVCIFIYMEITTGFMYNMHALQNASRIQQGAYHVQLLISCDVACMHKILHVGMVESIYTPCHNRDPQVGMVDNIPP